MDGNVVNDQVEEPVGAFRFGRDEAPDLKSGQVSVDLTLPRGNNGLFAVSNNPKYMVTSTVDYFGKNFAGSDYFFDRITPFSDQYNTRKMLGDPAYETRLVMDAIRKATYGHYLGNGEISTDLEQMKALYNNAAKEYERLDLKIGIALTPEQIKQLNSDIIWYVEKEVNGQKVLVPELYLCDATLEKIKIGGYGAKMTGQNIAIAAGNISNSGDMFAKNEITLKAQNLLNESNRGHTARIIGGKTNIDAETLINRSGNIGGEVTSIKANDILNETKKYTEEMRDGKNYTLVEKTGQEAVISGNKGLQIEASGTYAGKGAKLESKDGDVALKAENIVLDTVELHNREERTMKKSGFLSKKTTTTVKDSLKNVGSAIVAGGNALIESVKDLFSKGSKVEAGKDAQIVAGGDVTAVAAEDSSYSYSKTKKSSWGGLKKSLDEVEHEEKRLRSSNIKTTEGLTVVSGKDTNIVASNVEAGKDVNILAGYKAGTDGKVEKSGENGSVNILSGEETTKHREVHEKTDMMKTFTSGFDIGFEQGKISVNKDLGTETKDTWDNVQKNTISANIKAGGDINVAATEDVNLKGSNIISDNNISISAEKNINITSSESAENDQKTHSESNISAGVSVGHVAVDAVYAVDANIEAAEAVKKAKDNLEKIKKLHSQGKATANAVKDAEISLEAATVNLAFVTQAASQSMMNAKNTVPTLGFYAEAGVMRDTSQTETTTSSVVNTGSNIIAEKDINLNAGNDLNQIGSLVVSNAGNIDYSVGRDLNLQASKDMYHSDSKTSETSVSAGASTKSGAYGSVGTGKSNSKENIIEYNNSGSYAEEGKISYNVAGNMNAEGYNALAKDIDINVGGDMNLASKQNEHHANSSSNSYNAGFGDGAPNGGFGQSNGESNRQWVDNASSIVGTESVDIDVDGKLKMEGSLIANIDKDGIDQGNLNVKAGSLETNDIYNYDRNSESGMSININLGGNPLGTNDGYDKGKTHLVLTDNGSEKESVTHATIGKGNIEVADGSDTSGINRDINKTETITKDQITGALDVDITINHSIITDGPQKLVDDIADYHENMRDASGNLVEAGQHASDSLKSGFFNDKVVKPLLGLYNAIVGTPGGVIGTFDESRSALYVNGKKVPEEVAQEVLKKYQNYLVNGVLNSEGDAQKTTSKYDIIMRYNPSYGAFGDMFEALMGKVLGGNATTSDWLAMNRIVAGDLETRKDMDNANNIFHSQGTIIGTGAASIVKGRDVVINTNQGYVALGPAVGMNDWKKSTSQLVNSTGIYYFHTEGDMVRCLSTTDCVKNPSVFMKNVTHASLNKHDLREYLNSLSLEAEKK